MKYLPFCALLTAAFAAGCQSSPKSADSAPAAPAHNSLTPGEAAAGWRLLFDGKTTQGWHIYGKPGQPVSGWKVENGELNALGITPEGADIVSDEQFDSFELSLEWKIAPAGNSGIFFHVVEDTAKYDYLYVTGPEYQLVDDKGFPEPLQDWQKSAANYAMHPVADPPTKPVGEWNLSRLIVDGPHVEHYLNGVKTVEYDLWTPEWERLKAEGKWKDHPDYGLARTGHIGLQDHGVQSWFRNIKLRPIVHGSGADGDGD
jgi:hypothetical protein